ncbi:MAG: glycosyl hydrolase family 28-related protein, partial [Planctomycetota bacterium]
MLNKYHVTCLASFIGLGPFWQVSYAAKNGQIHKLTGVYYSVKQQGAVGDGKVKDTLAIQKVIDAANAVGGGTVYFPAGSYLSGTLYLKSKVTLHLEAGATLLGSTDLNDYPCIDLQYKSYSENYV